MSDPRNILIVHLAGLTQTTLALPALRSLRAHLPNSRITIVSTPEASELLHLAACSDQVLAIGRIKKAELLRPRAFYRSAKALGELRRDNFDLAIEFQTGTEGGLILQLAKPQSRLGARARRPLGVLLERVTEALLRQSPTPTHDSHEYLKRLEPLGVRPIESEPRLRTNRADDELIEELLRKHGVGFGELLIGVHPGGGAGGGSLQQRWPIERFASVASRMIHNFNARALIFAGPHERGAAKKIAALLPAKRAIPIESAKLSEFVSAAARLSLLIAHQSGPAHVAAAVGTPVVAASVATGPTPQDLPSARHAHVRALHSDLISEDEVFAAACRLLQMNRAEYLRAR